MGVIAVPARRREICNEIGRSTWRAMNPSVSLTSDSQKPPFRGADVRRRLDDHRIDVSRKGRWRAKQAGEPALDSGEVLRAAAPVQFVHRA